MKTYTMLPYYKSGDDLAEHLKKAKGDPIKALELWATHIHAASMVIWQLAIRLKGTGVEIEADTHNVQFLNLDPKLARALVKEELIHVEEIPEE